MRHKCRMEKVVGAEANCLSQSLLLPRNRQRMTQQTRYNPYFRPVFMMAPTL